MKLGRGHRLRPFFTQNGMMVHAARDHIGSHQARASPARHTPAWHRKLGTISIKIKRTSEGVLYSKGHKVVGSYPPPDCAVKCAVDPAYQHRFDTKTGEPIPVSYTHLTLPTTPYV